MIKISRQYTLQTLEDVTYLLPFGQNIAVHKRGIRLNDTGIFLWKKLQEGAGRTELLDALAAHYEAEPTDIPELKTDLDAFLLQLISLRILEEEEPPKTPDLCFRIGDITVGYYGDPDLLYPSLSDFACPEDTKVMQHILCCPVPKDPSVGQLLIKTDILEICYEDTNYIFRFPQQNGVKGCRISADGCFIRLYIKADAEKNELKQQLFYAFRDAFLFFAQKHGYFALHSASILHKKKAWLFSGCSGTGKSTHTRLWNKLFGTELLNGDLNLCKVKNSSVAVYGMPWCGTSNIYTPKKYPLGGIVLLKQAKENRIETLSEDEKQLLVSQRLISPSWTEELLLKNLTFAKQAKDLVPVFRLCCNMEDKAAETAKDYIEYLEQNSQT